MKPATRRFAAAYILLVVLPVLGLLAVLRAGRFLKAPFSVDGTWNVKIENDKTANFRCKVFGENSSMAISQSGEKFILTISGGRNAASPGFIRDTDLNARLQPLDAASPCGATTLTATLDPNTTPRSMTGLLSPEHCAACEPIHFSALRQTPEPKAAH